MKKIHKLVIKSFLGPLAITFAISMLVLLMQFLWKYVDDLVGKGLEVGVVLKFLYYASLTLVPMALPITVLFASIMTFGNLGERYELVAAKAAGVSLGRLMRPLYICIFLMAGIAFVFSNNLYPYAYEKYRTLLHDIQTKKPALNINEDEYYDAIDGYVIRVNKKGHDGKTIYGVQIYDHTEGVGNVRMTTAKHGIMQSTKDGKTLVFHLFDGYSYTEDIKEFSNRSKRPFSRIKFEEQKIKFNLSSFQFEESQESLFSNHHKMMNLKELNKNIDTLYSLYAKRVMEIETGLSGRFHFYSLFYKDSAKHMAITEPILTINASDARVISTAKESSLSALNDLKYYTNDLSTRRASIRAYEIEKHRKFTTPFTCLILFLIGAPLGAIIRKGGLGMPLVVSVFLFIIHFVLSTIGEKYAATADVSTWHGMWVSAFVFVPVGIFLLIKATTDAAFLDADVWRRKLGKLFERK